MSVGLRIKYSKKQLAENKKRLKTWTKTLDRVFNLKRSQLRAQFIELVYKGHEIKDICKLYDIPYHTFDAYCHKYNKELLIELRNTRALRKDRRKEELVRSITLGKS